MSAEYMTYQESVKMLREALRRNFPGIKFSVAKSYPRGTSVRVRYPFGPPVSEVDRVAQRFHCRDFDGMTDSNSYPSSLLVDSAGAMREVKHGIGFVFVERDTLQAYYDAVVSELGKTWEPGQWAAMQSWDKERLANSGISRITTRQDEPLADMAKRAIEAIFSPECAR